MVLLVLVRLCLYGANVLEDGIIKDPSERERNGERNDQPLRTNASISVVVDNKATILNRIGHLNVVISSLLSEGHRVDAENGRCYCVDVKDDH